MKKFLLASFMAGLLFMSQASHAAQQFDMAKVTCAQLMQDADDESAMALMLGWVDGYISAKSNNTMVSDEWFVQLALHMSQYCIANPQATIIEAMQAIRAN